MQINEEKRKKFMEFAGKRVNNVLHDIQILEPMSRSSSYDFTKQDVDEMFSAMQETLNNTRAEFERKFEEKARAEKKTFSFGASLNITENNSNTEVTPEFVSSVDNTSDYNSNPTVSNEFSSGELSDSTTTNIVETY